MSLLFRKLFTLLVLPLLLVSLACSALVPTPVADPEFVQPTQSSDISYRYDSLPDANHVDASVATYRTISQWDKFSLTYYFVNGTDQLPDSREQEIIRAAFALWQAQTPLTFKEVGNAAQADILVSWTRRDHGDGDPFDGPGDVLAHASFPNPYMEEAVILHFDDDERWVDSEFDDVDLLTVAAHEIGHNLGLDHSSDPNALMYPSYDGPRRFLGQDDINGIQSLYGIAAEPPSKPEVPPVDATPPPSQNEDRDNDGLSNEDELYRTGTDPDNPDSDGDGLEDGVEVSYGMNPLDADMDKDGVSDGKEVASGTDPFFPDQSNEISPELESVVSDFLTEAIELQINAYALGDASLASGIMSGDIYTQMQADIESLNQQGLVNISEIDYYESYIEDIRVVSETYLEVDTCEVWTTATYRLLDSSFVDSSGPELLPQTITVQNLGTGWFITKVAFFDSPAFCR